MRKKIVKCSVAVLLAGLFAVSFSACKKKEGVSNESTPLVLASDTLDGVFNPFFYTSQPDSNIIGLTQVSMLSTDKEGKLAFGENEPCVVLDMEQKTQGTGDGQYTDYTFVLKNNIQFSDGVPLTMKDVLFNMYVYLDPAYTGSATMYSVDIQGLKQYRMQSYSQTSEEEFDKGFQAEADQRVRYLTDMVMTVLEQNKGTTVSIDKMKQELKKLENQDTTLVKDYETAADMFRKELNSDFTNNMNGYETNQLLSNDVECFLFAEGYIFIKTRNLPGGGKEKYLDKNGINTDSLTRDEAIEMVYRNEMEKNFPNIVNAWQTANNLRTQFTAEAKKDYFDNLTEDERVKSISGIQWVKDGVTLRSGTAQEKSYEVAYESDGMTRKSGNEILKIRINGVDPKAVWNFGFTVAPLHYYSNAEQIRLFDGVEHFGVEFSSPNFLTTVVKDPDKIGVPLGAGPYKASSFDKNPDNVNKNTFFNNNVVYYERNDKFMMGAPKIKYVRYQVINKNQVFNTLNGGQIHYAEPDARPDMIANLNNNSDRLAYKPVSTMGYGYIGINAGKVPKLEARQAIMHAFDSSLVLNYYSDDLAELIYRPMSTQNWAYPKEITEPYYAFDSSGATSKRLLSAAGYTESSKLTLTFTVSGDSTEHPAYMTMKKAEEILNATGLCEINTVNDNNALIKLANGNLSVWAAAWTSTIDPDMFQVYSQKSTASSVLAWGYPQILRDSSTYGREQAILKQLSDLIDEGREHLEEGVRKPIYAQALDCVMKLAVEYPLYQRKDLFAYNIKIIDASTMPEITAFQGPMSRIWELGLNEG